MPPVGVGRSIGRPVWLAGGSLHLNTAKMISIARRAGPESYDAIFGTNGKRERRSLRTDALARKECLRGTLPQYVFMNDGRLAKDITRIADFLRM